MHYQNLTIEQWFDQAWPVAVSNFDKIFARENFSMKEYMDLYTILHNYFTNTHHINDSLFEDKSVEGRCNTQQLLYQHMKQYIVAKVIQVYSEYQTYVYSDDETIVRETFRIN